MDTSHHIPLAQPVSGEFAAELASRVYFVDEHITSFRLERDGELVRAVHLRTERPVATTELSRKIAYLVANDVLVQLPAHQQVRWQSARRDGPLFPAFAQLREAGLVVPTGDGQVAVAGPVLQLVERLDGLLRELVVGSFDAQEYRYPTLLPTAALRRSGYLSSFPQHVMFTTRLHSDLDVYRSFTAELAGDPDAGPDDLAGRVLSRCDRVDHCLPPTMCYHTFHQLSDGLVPAAGTAVTARGKAFRFESRYQDGLERLWDFTIRETVFLGPKQFSTECRDKLLQQATDLFDALDLIGECALAHDPFFGGVGNGESISAQRLMELKYEAQLAVAPDRTIAVGSFNLHGDRFGNAFQICLDGGGTATSSCVGFGLERLAYAVLCQHGTDPAGWPRPLRPAPVVVDTGGGL